MQTSFVVNEYTFTEFNILTKLLRVVVVVCEVVTVCDEGDLK